MPGSIARLSATLEWDLADFKRGTAHIERAFTSIIGIADRMADAVARAGRRMTLGITLPITAIGVLTTKAASDAEELQSAFDFTFGRMSKGMNRWAEDAGDAMGRATQEMQQGALAFGQLFKAAAPTEQAAARLSQRFTELAQDSASFFNTDFDTAMGKIRSGLTGEAEPLRAFGVFLSEAAVQAKALEMGLIETGQEIDEYGKIMARSALIAEGLSAAQGDIERTSGSLANRIRKIKSDIRELAVEIGELLEPYAQALADVVERLVARFKALPEWVKKAAIGFGVFLAALGPLSIVLSALAITVLPLLLVKMGPLAAAISLIINPIGTLVVMAGKAIAAFGGFGAILRLVGGVFLRFLGPVGLVISAILLFKDDIIAALERVWQKAREVLGPAFERLAAKVGEVVGKISQAWNDFANSEFGKFVGEIVDRIGQLIGAFVEIHGSGVIRAIEFLIDLIILVIDHVSDMVEIVGRLLSGDWAGAWDAAKDAVNNAISNMFPMFQTLKGWINDILQAVGLMQREVARSVSPAQMALDTAGVAGGVAHVLDMMGNFTIAGRGTPVNDDDAGGRNYALGGDPKKTSRGRSGPSAQELAARREMLRLEQELAVARERGDLDAVRALERQLDLADQIERYKRAGLSIANARAAAERDIAEIDAARAEAQAKAIATEERQLDIALAELRADHEHLRGLEDEDFLERQTLRWQREGLSLAEAEVLAQNDLLVLEEARAEQAERRLARQRSAHEIELARLRGDHPDDLRAMEEAARFRDRVDDLQGDFQLSRADAEAQAMREAADREQAHLQGTFRDAFRNGLQAALNGDLKGFFEGWMKDRAFNALSNVLDRLADKLAALLSGQGQGTGLLSAIGGLFGAGGIGGLSGLGGGSPHAGVGNGGGLGSGNSNPLPKFATGGSFRVKGHPGIDRNLLSLNGNPVARVSSGEIVNVQQGHAGAGAIKVVIEDTTGLFQTRVESISGGMLASVAPKIAEAGANLGVRKMANINSRSLG